MKPITIFLLLILLLAGCGRVQDSTAANTSTAPAMDERTADLARRRASLERFYKPMRVEEGDWLQSHPEDGETFEQYIASNPTLPTADRRTIYIQPAGKFTAQQMKVIELTADYMRAFFNLPVTLQKPIELEGLTPEAVRKQWPNNLQIRTSYFLDELLPPMLPNDAAALVCLTANDLFPGDTWNYVFGQASLDKRVGVWSMYRLGMDNGKPATPDLLLARTLKIAVHETGHMFSMRHCTKYECLMSGTNSLEETDRRPLDTCPECTAKIAWAMNYPLKDRYERLAEFWKKQKRFSEESHMRQKYDSLCDCRTQ